MFTRYGFTIPDDTFNYENLLKNEKSPSNIISENIIEWKNPLHENLPNKILQSGRIAKYQKDFKKFIFDTEYTNNINSNKIIPCNGDDNCLTRDIFNIMCLCCSLTYYLVNQSRVNIFDYFYTTNLIEELCIYYTLYTLNYNEISSQNDLIELIENIISLYYQIMYTKQDEFSTEQTDDKLNEFVKTKLNFLNTNLEIFLKDDSYIYKVNDNSSIDKLIDLLNILKDELNKNIFFRNKFISKEKIQKIKDNDYIKYFKSAYNIIYNFITNSNYDNIYKDIYIYNYTYETINLIKLRTYLLLMFMYKMRFINLSDVDDKGGRQAEFFISNVLRDFYNCYYIDKNILNDEDKNNIKDTYLKILKNLLIQYYYNNFIKINLSNNNIVHIYVQNNIITLEYIHGYILERFRPFEKMLNINECSNYKIGGMPGEIGGDLIYLHELYELPESRELKYDTLTSSSICIIVDSKAYQDSSFVTEYKIDKTIIQCYLYAQYVKECYTKNIWNKNNNNDNLYLSVVNPVYGSYYVYKYNDVENYLNQEIIYKKDKKNIPTMLTEYLKDYKLYPYPNKRTRAQNDNEQINQNNNNDPLPSNSIRRIKRRRRQ